MTYEIFKKELISLLEERIDADQEIDVRPVLKNNDLWLDGLSILQSSVNISPTIYLHTCYEIFQEGSSLTEIADRILASFSEYRLKEDVDLSFFTDFSKVRENIIYKLVNMEKNKELLAEVPFVPYLDLAVVFCYYILADETFPEQMTRSNASILIRNDMLDIWHITPKELLSYARRNTPKLLAPKMHSFSGLVDSMLEAAGQSLPELEDMEDLADFQMYVLTNANQYFGAAVMLYPQIMQKCAKVTESDFVILPSSVHELILLPYQNRFDLEEMSALVRQVNATCVMPEEVLSDHVYYYDHVNNHVSYS